MATCIPPILERTGAATSNRPRGCDGRRYRDEDPQRLKADGTLQIARLGILRSANGLWVAARLPWELDNRALLRGWAHGLHVASETTRRVANIKANRGLNIRRRTFAQGHNQGNDVQPLQLSGAEAGCTSGRRASRNRSLPRGLDYEPSSNSGPFDGGGLDHGSPLVLRTNPRLHKRRRENGPVAAIASGTCNLRSSDNDRTQRTVRPTDVCVGDVAPVDRGAF